MSDDDLITGQEAALILGMTHSYFRQCFAGSEVPIAVQGRRGGTPATPNLYRREDVERFREHRARSAPPAKAVGWDRRMVTRSWP